MRPTLVSRLAYIEPELSEYLLAVNESYGRTTLSPRNVWHPPGHRMKATPGEFEALSGYRQPFS